MITDKTILSKLELAFPKMYINSQLEVIIYPKDNIYFMIENCENEEDIKAKVLEFVSRSASKDENRYTKKYCKDGINMFLNTNFSNRDLWRIYTELGNRVNHELTLKFIRTNYDMSLLSPIAEPIAKWLK